jgi:hypothetical protein
MLFWSEPEGPMAMLEKGGKTGPCEPFPGLYVVAGEG